MKNDQIKLKIRTADLIHNKESNILFLILSTTRHRIELLQMCPKENAKKFEMSRNRFMEQVLGDKGKEFLIYYSVNK